MPGGGVTALPGPAGLGAPPLAGSPGPRHWGGGPVLTSFSLGIGGACPARSHPPVAIHAASRQAKVGCFVRICLLGPRGVPHVPVVAFLAARVAIADAVLNLHGRGRLHRLCVPIGESERRLTT